MSFQQPQPFRAFTQPGRGSRQSFFGNHFQDPLKLLESCRASVSALRHDPIGAVVESRTGPFGTTFRAGTHSFGGALGDFLLAGKYVKRELNDGEIASLDVEVDELFPEDSEVDILLTRPSWKSTSVLPVERFCHLILEQLIQFDAQYRVYCDVLPDKSSRTTVKRDRLYFRVRQLDEHGQETGAWRVFKATDEFVDDWKRKLLDPVTVLQNYVMDRELDRLRSESPFLRLMQFYQKLEKDPEGLAKSKMSQGAVKEAAQHYQRFHRTKSIWIDPVLIYLPDLAVVPGPEETR